MRNFINRLNKAREKRFVELANKEATPGGYKKYAPISKGSLINGLMIVVTGLISPFYVVWRKLVLYLSQSTERVSLLISAVVLALLLTVVYWNHFDNAFNFDDGHTIVNNDYITSLSNLPRFFTDVQTGSSLPSNQSYRPIVTSLNAFDYWIAGDLESNVYHWHIYLEFLFLLLLLFHVFTDIFKVASGSGQPYVALFATAFFAFHTATAETINYVIARSDGFSTLMVLAGLLIYMKSKGWRRQLGLVPFIIGCFAKPTTLMLAPILAVYSLILESPSLTARDEKPAFRGAVFRTISATWSYFVVGALIYVFSRSMYSENWAPGGNYSGLQYLNTQAFVVWIYLKTFVVPIGLTADTDLQIIREYLAPKVLWGLLVVTTMLSIALLASRRRATLPVTFGVLWFFIALIPSSSIIPLAEVMNHHRTFFPYIGLVMAASWATWLTFNRLARGSPSILAKGSLFSVIIIFLGFHAWGTYQRNEVWESDESLWRDVAKKSPNNGRGLMNYGLALMKNGRYEEALEYYNLARNTSYGNHPYLVINQAIVTNALAKQNDSEELKQQAEVLFQTAIYKGPGYPETHYRYANWLYENGQATKALGYVNRAIELAPANKDARALRKRMVQSEKISIEQSKQLAAEENTPEAYMNLSLKYYNLGQFNDCIDASLAALELRPDYALAYNNICSAYNMLKQYDQAIQACEKALEIDPDYSRANANLQWGKDQKAKLEQ